MIKSFILLLSLLVTCQVFSQDSQEIRDRITEENYKTIFELPFSGLMDDPSNDRWPLYINGLKGLNSFIENEIKYPESALSDSITGLVIFDYVITKKGNITQIRILESPDIRLSNEVIRVMKLTGPWISGIKDDEYKTMRMSKSYEFK